ncbi:LysR family transcriptional regulator [Oxalobacteraceae bacterium OTU3CINTB1]|nr:LysR family transcriptional regulator [Oxalobacteraceae bacterium OTU3CINTB1]
MESLTGLIAFARTASLGSYTAAAQSLGVSPSAVSKSVQRLEEQLSVKLFTRTTRSLALSPEGRDMQERTARLLLEVEQIEQAAANSRTEPAGLLRVSAPLPVGVHILAPALHRFRERHPKVKIDLRMGDRHADLIEEGIDVALRVGEVGDSRLIARPLAPHRLCAFAAPAYLARRGTPLALDELAAHDCVNFRYQGSGQSLRWPFQIGERIVEMTPDAGIIIDATDGVLAALVSGGGIGIAPTYAAADYVARGLLVPILPELAVERFTVTALWPESRRGSPTVKAFVEFLLEIFPSPAPWDLVIAAAQGGGSAEGKPDRSRDQGQGQAARH